MTGASSGVPIPRSRLFRKYALLFTALVGAALLTAGLVQTLFSYEEQRAALVELQGEKARRAAATIEQFVSGVEREIGATLPPRWLESTFSFEQRRDELRRLLRQAAAVSEVAYVDVDGRERLRSSRVAPDVVDGNADRSAEAAFVEARAAGKHFSAVYFRNDSEPYMTVAVGAPGRGGVIVAEVNLTFVWDVVSQITVGQSGHAYVVDARGRLIAHPDISLVLRGSDLSSLHQVRAALGATGGGAVRAGSALANDLAGRQVLAAYRTVDPPGWSVFVEQPLEEAYAPLYASLARTAALLAVGLTAAVLASLFLARRMAAPIEALRAGAARIGEGALEHRVEVRTGDELETLAAEFNRMGARLRDSYADLEHQALHDRLTGLPNRTLLNDRTSQAIVAARRRNEPVTLLLMDLDGFKDVNDTFGHDAGDALLREVGGRLHRRLREADTIARLGGDEFAVLLPGLGLDGATRLVQRILEEFARPFVVEGQALDVGASVGLAVYPEHADDPETLLQRADIAMYAAKRSREGYAVYATASDTARASRLALMADLRRGLANGELTLHYQPLVDLATGRVHSLEALARWPHPRLGMVPPGEFIPLAEHGGLIRPLASWALDAALSQSRRWRDAGLPHAVAVNLSTRNLLDPQLPAEIATLLGRRGTDPRALTVEVTESAFMTEPERALEILLQLKGMGIRLAVDDFGTGYSSLAYLSRLPIDEVKIDRSFVQAMARQSRDHAIVRSTIDLAHDLRFHTVAEGVEDERSLGMLRDLGCDAAQGFYLARPMSATEVERWFAERSVPAARGEARTAARG